MRTSLWSILLALAMALIASSSAAAQRLVIVGFAPGFNEANQAAVIDAAKKLYTKLDPGDTAQFYDLGTRELVTTKVVPKSDAPRARLVACRAEIAALTAHLKAPSPPGRSANVPAFLTGLRLDGKPARVILVTSLFHSDERDAGATFVPGQCPSDRHLLCSSRESIYGTSDLKNSLPGVMIDWVSFDDTASTLELRAVTRFWSAWANELGMVVTSVEGTVPAAVEHAVAGLSKPLTTDITIDRADTVMEIRTLGKPAPSPSFDKPVTHEVELAIVQDGSGSMLPAIERTKRLTVVSAELGAKLTPRFALGIVVYRNAGGFSTFPLTRIERVPAGGGEPAGMASLRGFMDEPALEVNIIEGAEGENAGRRTGATKRVSRMAPLTAYVDFEGGVRASLDMLEKGNPKARKVLLLVGDMGTAESDGSPGVSAADAAAAERTLEMTRAFITRFPDTRIVTVYCGTPTTPDRADSIDLFKRLAALANARGVFSDDLSGIDALVTQAMLNP